MSKFCIIFLGLKRSFSYILDFKEVKKISELGIKVIGRATTIGIKGQDCKVEIVWFRNKTFVIVTTIQRE